MPVMTRRPELPTTELGLARSDAAPPSLTIFTSKNTGSIEEKLDSQPHQPDVSLGRLQKPICAEHLADNGLATSGSPRHSGLPMPGRVRSPKGQEYNPGSTTLARMYEPDASIALVGFRGTGMSSLALIASTALGFRLVDADQHFYRVTGASRRAYRSTHGTPQYRKEELTQMRSILWENPTKAIIVCGPGAVEGTGQSLLSEYGKAHPVVHVLRDSLGIQQHLSVWDTDTISQFIRISSPIYRSLSSFEFYNLDESCVQSSNIVLETESKRPPQTLVLKPVEENFLHLIRNITPKRAEQDRECETRYGLGSLSPEARPYSYALALRITTLERVGTELRDIDTYADAVELILPFELIQNMAGSLDIFVADDISRLYYKARRDIRLPIIFHVEQPPVSSQPNTDGKIPTSAHVCLAALHHGLRLAPEYLIVDLSHHEQSIRQLVTAKGSTKIIGHHFDREAGPFGWSKPERKAMLARAEDLGCDMVRLCQEAAAIEDNFAAQTFVQKTSRLGQHRIPVIAYNTGPLGRMSNFLNTILTPVTHSILRSRVPECTSTALLTIPEAQRALYASFVLDPLRFGIYGNNVSQSLSPAMHNAAFKQCGMPHTYQAYTYPTLQELNSLVRDPEFGGMSITAPFKRDVMAMVDRTSREARAIGAVNTLLPLRTANADPLRDRNRKGPVVTLYGDNTDWIGIYACIRHNLSPINAVQRQTTGLIIGAGGMARAAAYAMIRLGVRNILVYSRSVESAKSLARQFHRQSFDTPRPEASFAELPIKGEAPGTEILDWPNGAPVITVIRSRNDPWPAGHPLPTIIVSSVPHSLAGEPMTDDTVPVDWLASPTGGVVIELSYTPLETPLLEQTRALGDRGWIAIDGLQVLPEQGAVQFEHFTSRKAPRELMRRTVRDEYLQRVVANAGIKDSVERSIQ